MCACVTVSVKGPIDDLEKLRCVYVCADRVFQGRLNVCVSVCAVLDECGGRREAMGEWRDRERQ